jgi:RimJ/RimL family protein N-acetyltransferase
VFQDRSQRAEKIENTRGPFRFNSLCERYLTLSEDAAFALRLHIWLMIELQAPDWWHEVPTLSGPTVQVREVDDRDTGSLFELLTDAKVARYISTPPPSAAAFHGFIEWAHRRREAGTCVCFAVVPRGLNQAIGLFQLRALEPSFTIAEWGFALGSAFWSTGIFTEAASLVADFAFKTIGVHRLEARAVIENGRGNRALEKLGARGEAVLRKSFGKDYSQFLWAIVAEEWQPPPAAAATAFDAAKLKRDIARAIAATPVPQAVTPSASAPFPFFLTDASGSAHED